MLLSALCIMIIIVNIINIVYLIKANNRLKNKYSKKESPDYCVYESKQSNANNIISVHKKEFSDGSISKLDNKLERISNDLVMIKRGKMFVVTIDGYPVTKVEKGLNGEIGYLVGLNYSAVLNTTYDKPVVMNLSEAKNIAERINGKVVFVEDFKSVVYDYTEEQ